MPLFSYADLQTQALKWIGRTTDADLIAALPDCITLFEAWVARRLRVREQETVVALTTSGGSVALPTDYLSWRQLKWTGAPDIDLGYLTPSGLTGLYPQAVAGIPTSFTIQGGNILIRNTDDTASAFAFDYFQKTAALSGALNWLWTKYPDAYLWGTLTEAYGFQKDADNMATWGSRRNDVFDEIERLDMRTRAFGRIVVAGPTP